MSPFIKTFAQFLFFFLFWIALSGRLDKLSLSLGFLTVLFVLVINKSENKKKNIPLKSYLTFWKNLIIYLPWLTFQILFATVHVVKIILSPKMKLDAGFRSYESSVSSDVLKVMIANTITLTPGTIAVDIKKNTFTIYAMDSNSAQSILNGELEKRIFNDFKIGKLK